MRLHEQKDLRAQIAFLSYYFHWSYEEIICLSHIERKAYCNEIMSIHQKEQSDHVDLMDIH